MDFVKITKGGETKTVEKGVVHIYAMRGWTVVKESSKPAYAPTANPYPTTK